MKHFTFNLFPTFSIEDIAGFDRNEDSEYEIYSQEIEVNIVCKLTDKGELYRLPDAVCSKFNVIIHETEEELVTRENFTSGEQWAAETKAKTTVHTFARNTFDINVDSIISDSFSEMLEGFAEMEIDLDSNIIKI